MKRALILIGVAALVIVLALALTDPAHGAARPKPRPCIGVVVRTIDPGIEIVKQKNGKLCQRPALLPVKKPVKVKR